MRLFIATFLIFSSSFVFAKDSAKKAIVTELITRSADIQKIAIKEIERQFKNLQTDSLLAEENDKLTTSLISEVQNYLDSSLKRQKKALDRYGLTELENLKAYLQRQQDKSLKIAQIPDLEVKVRDFFKSGASQKIPNEKLTMINDYYLLTKMDEMIKSRAKASEPFIRKTIKQDPKIAKAEIERMIQAVHHKTAQSSQLHFLYTHYLESDDDLKKDLEFFKSGAFKRYLESQMQNSKRQTEILMKHMTKLMGKIEEAEKKKKKKK